jgi:hypothetical protein
MRARAIARAVSVAGAVLTIALLPVEPSTAAAVAKRPPIPVASVTGSPSPRIDQDTTTTVRAVGASREAVVSVSWGDSSADSRASTRCPATRATRLPSSCAVTVSHVFNRVGTFPITVRSGARVIARTSVTVRPRPQPWTPPAGWVQPAGWSVYPGGATYVPCSTVSWYYDRTREPRASAGMRAEIIAALAVLAKESGLTFAEVSHPSQANLTLDWTDVDARYPGAAAVGGSRGRLGFVHFSPAHWWTTDQWPGFGIVTQPDGTYAVGRGWLVVHESMHALGMGHVDDPTAIMNSQGGATAFSPGDLDGLRTMYLNNPCPV